MNVVALIKKLPITINTLIVGASAAGLATAACLQKQGIALVLLEKSPGVGTAWRNHYDRLHLHTSKKWSALPYKKFDASVPTYPSKRQVVDYLEGYEKDLDIHPVFNEEVTGIKREGDQWVTTTNRTIYHSRFVVVATGMNNEPVIPRWEGIDSFKGTVIHSSQYKNGKAFSGKQVLVIGFGNSACEQAICLHEHGAHPALSVRSAVNVLPRDIFGFPVLEVGKLTSMFSPKMADKINAPLLRLLVGDITRLGLKKSSVGPLEQIEKQKKIPLLDIGTIKLIRQGHIKVFGDILRIEGNNIYFEDKKEQHFDAIILATGYQQHLESFLPAEYLPDGDINKPLRKQTGFGKDGLYFCGFYLSPMGMLREIGIEAIQIAAHITRAGKK